MPAHRIILTLIAILALNLFSQRSIAISTTALNFTEFTNNQSHSSKDNWRISQMRFYASLSLKDYEKLRGKKLNFVEKQLFKISQHRMKKMLKAYEGDGPTTIQKISWLLKGLLLGPIALILGYIFLKDEERELIKWIWFGFIGFVAIVIAILVTM